MKLIDRFVDRVADRVVERMQGRVFTREFTREFAKRLAEENMHMTHARSTLKLSPNELHRLAKSGTR